MTSLIKPYGASSIITLLLEDETREEEKRRAETYIKIPISSREVGDLIMLGIGGFTPLTGFMSYSDWRGVCNDMQLSNGLFWPVPITLSTDIETAKQIKEGDEIALVQNGSSGILATMRVEEKYAIDKIYECREVFKTNDTSHPGVINVLSQSEVNLAGPVKVLTEGPFRSSFPNHFLTPLEVRSKFISKGWKSVAAFQTRNPMHRAHEYISKLAIEICDGLLVHSLLGNVKEGDIPASVRTRAIDSLIENYFVQDTVIHAGYPLDMRYAGPREALLHALFRQNYGCSHIIIGRDHAGVNDCYGHYDAQKIFDEIPTNAMEIKPIKVDCTFWCKKCDEIVSSRNCPHSSEDREFLSGTSLREKLSNGGDVPKHFSRIEVIKILRAFYHNKQS